MQLLLWSCLSNQWIFEPTQPAAHIGTGTRLYTQSPQQKTTEAESSFPFSCFLRKKPSFFYLELLNFIICAIVLDTALLLFSLQTAIRATELYTIHFSSDKTPSNKNGSSLFSSDVSRIFTDLQAVGITTISNETVKVGECL